MLIAILFGSSSACLAAGAASGSTLQRVERAASAAATDVDKAVVKTENAVKRGARKADHAIERGVKAANRGVDRVGAKVGLPPGSAPTGRAAAGQQR